MISARKVISLVLCFLLIFSACFVSLGVSASALYNRHGYINDSDVNIRKGAGTNNESLGKLENETAVLIKGVGFDNNGVRWYELTAYTENGNIDGYVHSDYVTVTGSDVKYSASVTKTATLRSAPGTWNASVTQLAAGTRVTIIGCEDDSDGDKWYHISYESGDTTATAYIYETYVEILVEYETDEAFEKYLTEQGFPESYKPYLRNLHAMYPKWRFVADHLEITWDEAVEGESALGRSVVTPSASAAWKSMKEGTYDWTNSIYETWDSGGWVQAADSVIEYYLDPRNFLNSSGIYQFASMTYIPELHTRENVVAALKGTFMEKPFPEDTYETYADVLIEAAEQSGVSPVALAAMIIVEQGSSGGGKSISGTVSGYEGYYNYYNIRAYRSGSYSAIQYGLLYAKGSESANEKYMRPWNTRTKAIIGGAVWYNEKYLSKGQDTLYYKKFNVISKPFFSHQYMTNVQGAASEANVAKGGYSRITDSVLIFDIPVYKQMPSSAAPYPTKTGNNNCYLADLSVDSYKFTPTFTRYTNEYEFVVKSSVDSVVVAARTSDSNATVTGSGKVNLNYGNNRVDVKVTATSGLENVYSLYIYREIPEEVPFDFTLDKYTVINGNVITDIPESTLRETFITNLNVVGGTAKITKNGNSSETTIGTGDVIEITDNKGEETYTYYLCVKGDLNGDGLINLVDLSWLQRHLVFISRLEGYGFLAADLNGDGNLSLVDLSRLQRKLLKLD